LSKKICFCAGYAVTSGHFFGTDQLLLVASSAPKYHGKGAVLIYYSFEEETGATRHRIIGQQVL